MEPDYSIVVPAFNEEAFLPATLEAIREAHAAAHAELGLKGETVVVDNNSTDRTSEVARGAGADQVVFEPVNQISRSRNAGARAAKGRFLVFLDADTHLPPALLVKALAELQTGECCGGGACIDTDHQFPPPASWMLALWNRISANWGLAAGSFIYCTAEAFEAADGFDETVFAGEEIWFSKHVGRWGKGHELRFTVFESPRPRTSARKGEWVGGIGLFLQMFLIFVFPWATKSRALCWTWYRRPDSTRSEPDPPPA